MNKSPNNDNEYPDISGVFDIDEENIPTQIIKNTAGTAEIRERFLTADEAIRFLPEEEQKKLKKEKKAEKKRIKRDKRRVRLIIILSAVLALLIIAAAARTGINEAKKPVISYEKPITETISRYSLSEGISVMKDGIMQGVFIDNNYDVHYIETGHPVQITDENGITVTGKVARIQEEAPDSPLITKFHTQLFETKPSTSSYAVYVTVDSADAPKKEGLSLSFKTITQSSENALTVSTESVCIDGNQPYVWVYSAFSKTLSKTEVRTGLSFDGRTEITAGIKKSDKIMNSVSTNPEALYDGIKVKVSK